MLCVTGDPYDTLEEVLGVRGDACIGNLSDWGVTSRCHYGLFTDDGGVDPSSITYSIDCGMAFITRCLHGVGNMAHRHRCGSAYAGHTRVCHIQRSCGYSLRPTLTIQEIRAIVNTIRAVDDSILITVDNCYGAPLLSTSALRSRCSFTVTLTHTHIPEHFFGIVDVPVLD
jgi:cystathionine beta-lyase family protein involved in aluminum resistance